MWLLICCVLLLVSLFFFGRFFLGLLGFNVYGFEGEGFWSFKIMLAHIITLIIFGLLVVFFQWWCIIIFPIIWLILHIQED